MPGSALKVCVGGGWWWSTANLVIDFGLALAQPWPSRTIGLTWLSLLQKSPNNFENNENNVNRILPQIKIRRNQENMLKVTFGGLFKKRLEQLAKL